MAMQKRAFGELELALLKTVKERGSITVKEALEKLPGESRYTTVMTVMNRLVEKGELSREKKGRQYEYSIASKKATHSFSLLDRLKAKLFGGKSLEMISYLLEDADDISDQHLAEIEKTISEARKSRNDA